MYALSPKQELEDTYIPGIPPSLTRYMISNADKTFHTSGDYGLQLFQVIKSKSFEAWQIDFEIKTDTTFTTSAKEPDLDMHIAIQNDFKYTLNGIGEIILPQRRFNFTYSPLPEGNTKFEKDRHYQYIEIHPNLEVLKGLVSSFPILDKFLHNITKEKAVMLTRQHPSTTGDMLAIIYRILYNSYEGPIKDLYLETKLFELLVLGLHQSEQTTTKPDAVSLSDYEKERIQEAKDYLITNMDNPCSISWLAKHLRLSERKLRLGFKQQYGTTPFDFMLEARLEKAMELLLTTHTPVQEMAAMTGYSYVPNFIAAFTKRFGQTPGSFLKKKA
ncbi:AraC-type DNA-binding protein [Chitinophaga sp. CF118]|uniref:helix-turn-helix transcriptional regulator n=1 Tax=Chitinophaga sp. CF118 TaxID=1884367 RepID=UPI0008DEBE5B|nr:response regulator transcription factor [Chitinophaga sp. CF118]SFE84255.1 AraC-type DNA-binding protein [Chitinophaga sp. CF118]